MNTLLFMVAALLTSGHADPVPADVVLADAWIWSDGLAGPAEFAAIRDGRFVYVGTRDPRYIDDDTVVINAAGRTVIPGLIDSHVHLLSGGFQRSRLQLREAADRDDFVLRIREWAEALEPDAWILGGRWSVESWPVPQLPPMSVIDDAAGGRPLMLSRMDGHSALVNSEALRLAGITDTGPADPVGGVIDRDRRTGMPTGVLRESAMDLVGRHVPAPSHARRVRALRDAMDHAIAHGITAVSDIPSIGDLAVYESISATAPIRLFLYPTADDWPQAIERARRFRGRPGRVEIRGFKAYLDGSLGSRTAAMEEPYLNATDDWRGLWAEGVEEGRFALNVAAAADAGYQSIVHAIGDAANHLLLETLDRGYENVRAARGRSEHAQHLRESDIPQFAELGVIASMQPYHKADDGRYAEASIGADRARSSYAYKSLLDAGAVVAFGSDWPVVSINPFLGIEAAVTGRILSGGTWQTQENITVAEALRCYTSRAAYAVFAEKEIGRIQPGYRADFVILDGSPFGSDPDFEEIKPWVVSVEGRLVLDRR